MNAFLTSIGYDSWILPALLDHSAARRGGDLVAGAGGRRPKLAGDEVASGAADGAALARADRLRRSSSSCRSASGGASIRPTPAGSRSFDCAWIPSWGIRFTLGVDGIALMMILLTTFIMLLAVGGSWTSIRQRTHSYYALLLVLTTGMLGVFMALDLFLFYVMWEVMLVPMYFIVGIWGGERRIYASLKFFIYTMVGSLLMLVGDRVPRRRRARNPATGIAELQLRLHPRQRGDHAEGGACGCFGAFFLAFAVKVPMFPFHTWLPDAHVEAPTAGSVVLASIMLKLGTFGFLRLAVPLFPSAAMNPTIRTIILDARGDRHRLRRARLARAAGLQEARRVFVGEPPRLRDARHLRAHRAERAGRADGDDQPRHLDGRAVLPHRHDLRAPPHAPDRGVRRHRARRADVRGDAHDRHVQQHRRAGDERLRRRVPRAHRRRSARSRSSRSSRRRPSSSRRRICSGRFSASSSTRSTSRRTSTFRISIVASWRS